MELTAPGQTLVSQGALGAADIIELSRAVAVRESRTSNPEWEAGVARTAMMLAEAIGSNPTRRGLRALEEAITTAEFAGYFGDVLDRALFARFSEWVPPFNYVRQGTFSDLTRDKRRTQFRGGNDVLGRVGELGPYPVRGVESVDFTWKGEKYGADFVISWESLLADDLNGLADFPGLLASAARNSEARFITELYVSSGGPNSTLYSVGNGNLGTAAMSITSLAAGIAAMTEQVDPVTGTPISSPPRYLVVPPALSLAVDQILNSTSVAYAATAGSAIPLVTANIIPQQNLVKIVNPWLPIIDTTSGDTAWYLFSEPNAGPLGPGLAALEFDRLRGMTAPLLLQRRAAFQTVGGGADPRGELSDMDAAQYRVVHAMGGSRLFPQATYASTGAG